MSTMRKRRAILVAAPLAIVSLLTTAASCGGSSGSGSGGSGGGKSALNCNFTTLLEAPVQRQIAATSSVICDFPVTTSKTTLVIQGRKTGSGNTAWDNFDDPKSTTQVPPNELSYTVACIGGYDYQASADITGVGPNGQPFHSDETTPVASYSAADCSQS